MMQHAWTVLAKQVFVDKNSDGISLVVAEELRVPGELPVRETSWIVSELELLSLWAEEDAHTGDGQDLPVCELRLLLRIRYQGELAHEAALNLRAPSKRRMRIRVPLQAFPFRGFGRYLIELAKRADDNWTDVACVPLDVVPIAVGTPSEAQ